MDVHALINIQEECYSFSDSKFLKINPLEFTCSIQISLILSGLQGSFSINHTFRLILFNAVLELFLVLATILVFRLDNGSFIDGFNQFDKIGGHFEGASDRIPPPSEHIICDVFPVHVHPIDVNFRKVKLLIDTSDDLFFKHFLTDLGRPFFVRFHVFKDPSVDIAAVDASNVLTEPPVFIIHDPDIVPDQFCPVTELLKLERPELVGFRVLSEGALASRTYLGGRFLGIGLFCDDGVGIILHRSRDCGFLVFSIVFDIKDGHNLISQVELINELNDLLFYGRHLSDVENARAFVIVFVQE